MLRRRIDVQDSPGEADAAVEMPGFDVVINGPLDDLQVRGVKPVSVRRRPLLVFEVERESTIDMPRPRS